jgi:hypothetical protein
MLVAQPVRESHSFVNSWTLVWIQLQLTIVIVITHLNSVEKQNLPMK